MKKRSFFNSLISKIMIPVLCLVSFNGLIMPEKITVHAALIDFYCFGTSGIGDPALGGGNWRYVYFGKYDNEPVKYRVLQNDTSDFGGRTMLLDCDSILYSITYDGNSTSFYNDMNGSDFLTKPNVFSEAEKDAIATSSKAQINSSGGDTNFTSSYRPFVSLSASKIFTLDCAELGNENYGYKTVVPDPNRKKQGKNGMTYWLTRSLCTAQRISTGCGYPILIDSGGNFPHFSPNLGGVGVSPALNIDLEHVFYSSQVSAGGRLEYKLTLNDSDITIAKPNNSSVTQSGRVLSIPYEISGNHANQVNQISMLIVNSALPSNGMMNDYTGYSKYYGALEPVGGTISNRGRVTFDTNKYPDDYNPSTDKIYIFAEVKKGDHESNFASNTFLLDGVIHNHDWDISTPSDDTAKVKCTVTGCPYTQNREYTATINVSDTSKSYDGTPVTAEVTKDSDFPDDLIVSEPKYKIRGATSDLAGPPSDAGEYTAYATVSDGTNANTVTITKDFEITQVTITDNNLALSPTHFDYDGSSKEPSVIVTNGNIVLTENTDYTVSGTRSASAINETPGYEVIVTGTGNYTGTGTKTWIIRKGVPIITTPPVASEIEYGQSLADSVLSGGVGNVPGTFTWAQPTIKPAVSDSEVTEYMVIFTPNDTDSYYGTASTLIKVKVNKAPSNYVTRPTGKHQDSSEREVELANPGSTSDGTLLYALGTDTVTAPAASAFSTTIPKAKNPGTYYVWYKIVGDANHRDSAPEYVATVLVGNAPRIITPPVASEIDYGQSLASSVLSGGTSNVPGTFAWAEPTTKPEVSDSNYTEYLVIFTPYDRTSYIGTDTARVRVKVNKVPSNYITRPTGNQLISGDLDVALANLGSTAEGTILYALGTNDTTPPDAGSFSTKVPKAKGAGTYYIWYKIVGDANHKDSAPECITTTLVEKVDPENAANKPAIDKEIAETNTDKTDVKDTKYYILAAKLKPKGKTLKLSWNKIPEAEGYMIYGSPCGIQMEYITTIKNSKVTSWSPKKIKKGRYYKYIVIAYKMEGDVINRISTSKSVHAVNGSKSRGNPIAVTIKKRSFKLAKGGMAKISANFRYTKKVSIHIAKLRYETNRPDIVKVDKKGYIQGLKPGKAWVYVYAQNGVCKTVRVTVK
ncbi:Ig-like domain-containing protein [Butyrivibrio sp. INlla16]|uniref:Ig-like domain-containing protein n=1 Tax=Butyrivibrio sp. INlla16 TaxID=1520807 RepID=UPI00088658D3|nr:Ig-like domain-containing protein [Butyrivibrio sp. INlla16]SDB10450.1 Ig-like domain (group 2) [Butyrivibrio sp. INlla16]